MRFFDGFRRAFQRPIDRIEDVERDVDEELSFHLSMREERLRAAGLSASDAAAEARRRFGDVGAIHSECVENDRAELRVRRVREHIADIVRDFRIGARSLTRVPILAFGTMSLLALGVGGTTAVFSILNAIYFRTLPYPSAERLVSISLSLTDGVCARGCLRTPTAAEIGRLDGLPTIEASGTLTTTQEVVELPGGAFVLEGAEISRDVPSLLGLHAVLGRSFTGADFANDAGPVLVLSHSAWISQFGGDSAVVGRLAKIGDRLYRIVGVLDMSSELGAPLYSFNVRTAQYLTASTRRTERTPSQLIARLREAVSPQTAAAGIDSRLGSTDVGAAWRAHVVPLRSMLSARYRGSFALLLAAIAVVLAIICLNVTGLLVARLNERMPEMATRAVLGAGRAQLVRLVVAETFIIASMGGIGGLVIAYWATAATRWLPLNSLPFWTPVAVDLRVIAFALALSICGGVALSVVPIAVLSPTRVVASMRGLMVTTPTRARLRGFIVTSEVALSVMLLAAAATLTKQLVAAEQRDLGWSKRSVVYLSLLGRNSPSDGFTWTQRVEEGLRALPGVVSVGIVGAEDLRRRTTSSSDRPAQTMTGTRRTITVAVEGQDEPFADIRFGSASVVSDSYFDAIGTRLTIGRVFGTTDNAGTPAAAIINTSAAVRLFGTPASAIGKRFRIDAGTPGTWLTVVGVAADEREPFASDAPTRAVLYRPARQVAAIPQNVVVRVNRDTRQMAPVVRDAMHAIDRSAPIASVLAIEDGVAQRMWTARFNTNVFLVFAALAIGLACLGVYATVSYAIARRRRELAVRIAIGAGTGDVIREIVRGTNRLIVPGLIAGIGGVIVASRFLQSLLYGTNRMEVSVVLGVVVLTWVAALGAAYLPARRAVATDVIDALRAG